VKSNIESVIDLREKYSIKRLNGLESRIKGLDVAKSFPGLTIVGAGSFARYEGSEHSDIDLFFFCNKKKEKIKNPKTKEISLFGNLIELIKTENFPPFSSDSRFLEVLYLDDVKKTLGSPSDDHQNFFTARMLLILESKCLFNKRVYEDVVKKVISYYYKDYPRHSEVFYPTFLLNDISRYWKTLLLNYENKRVRIGFGEPDIEKVRHKIKNFKIKFSRMTTCFATISAIGSFNRVISESDVFELVLKTPRERLKVVVDNMPSLSNDVARLLEEYSWFIEKTGLSSEDLEKDFSEKEKVDEFFKKANDYGKSFFKLLQKIDDLNGVAESDLIRRLVI